MLGVEPRDVLEPLLRAEPYVRSIGSTTIEVFPLAVPPGIRVAIPLGALGEFAVANERGLLAVTVPAKAAPWLASKAGPVLAEGPTPIRDDDGVSRVATAWLRLVPGMRAGVPLGLLGELGLEAA